MFAMLLPNRSPTARSGSGGEMTDLERILIERACEQLVLRYARCAETGGRIGYIYVPNTGQEGQNDLFRQFYGQIHIPTGIARVLVAVHDNRGGEQLIRVELEVQ